ncbi:MAG: hypothetical protein EA424_24255 [Planctomycetaceae bacterium]|nr:MAG: hypothetical protein EA424_24255 [Planctomycetaceae bacterium]
MTGASGRNTVFAAVARRALLAWLLSLTVLCAGASSTVAAESPSTADPSTADPSTPLEFRRVFVVDEALSKLALDGWYLPVRREDFESLIRSAAMGGDPSDGVLLNRIVQSTYTARLAGTQRLEGEAQLRIAHRGGRESALVLEPCNLVINQAGWRTNDAELPDGPLQEATAQPRIGFDEDGQFTILLSESGALDLAWSLRSLPDSTDFPSFLLQVPESPLTQFTVELPGDLQPLINQGFVTLDEAASEDQSWNRWILEMGSQSRVYLRLVPYPDEDPAPREWLVRQQTTFRFSPQDVEVEADVHLDIVDHPLSQLTIGADPVLQVVDITLAGQSLRWTELRSGEERELLVEMPEPLIGLDHRIRLHALAPIELDREWSLPMVRVPQGLWSHAMVRLEVPETLVLQKLDAQGAHQIGRSADQTAGESMTGESVTLQCFDPQAQIAVRLGLPSNQIQVHHGTSVLLGRGRTSLVHSARFTTEGPPRFELTLATPLRWNVDQIESSPADILEQWSFVGRTGTSRLVQIRLREPLAPDRPLSLKITAHSDGLRGGARLTGGALRLGQFLDTRTTSSLFALNAEPPWQIRLDGDGQLHRVAADQLEPDQQKLVNVSSGTILFEDSPAMEEMAVDLRSEPPDYAVRIDLECEVGQRSLESVYRIRVQPQASPIDRLQIHFSGPPDQRLRWTQPDGSPPINARRLPVDPIQGVGGELWQVVLPEPAEGPFEIRAAQKVDFEGQTLLSLAAIPGATSQMGTVTIRSAAALPLEFEVQNVRSIPAEPLAAGRSSSTRAVYRYDPSQDCRIAIQHAPQAAPQALAWAWSCDLVTRHYRDGKTLHLAEYQIEAVGAGQVTFTAPESVEWLSARIDGRDVPLDLSDARTDRLTLPLPRGARFSTLQIRYVTDGRPLQSFGNIAAVWLDCDHPVFRRSWVAWLPPGFASLTEGTSPLAKHWPQRLLGSLLRSSNTPAFEPWSLDGWTALMHPSSDVALSTDRQKGSRWLEDLWSQYQHLQDATSEQSALTWGELLRGWASVDEDPNPKEVWIDQLALGAEGLSASSPVPSPIPSQPQSVAKESPAERGARLLTAAHLALLIDEDRLLFTTTRRLFDRKQLTNLPGLPHVFSMPADDVDALLTQQPDQLRWISLDTWIDQPPLPQTGWRHAGIPSLYQSGEIAGSSGWTAERIPATALMNASFDSSNRSHLTVYQPLVIQSLGWAALLAAMGLTIWLVRRRLPLAWPLAGLAGLAALLAPTLWTPVFQFLFLGTLLGSLLALVRAARPEQLVPIRQQDLPTTSLLIRSLAWWAVLVALASQTIAASGNETDARPTAHARTVYPVLSPIDSDRDPQGEYVYLPAEFYERLLREASPSAADSRSWMIYDAAYQAMMSWNAAEERLSVVELSVTYDLEVFRPLTAVRLPLLESQAHLLPNRALLDGSPATVRWLEDQRGLALDIDQIGRYRVALAFRPHVRRNGDFDHFEVAIPRVGNSRLRIELPPEADQVHFPTALGGAIPALGVGTWQVQLGPTERLVARWPTDMERIRIPDTLELDKLMWLRVRPDGVQLDTRLRFSKYDSPISRVDLIADHRLRLLPPADDSPIAWYESTRGATQIIHLEFKPPYQQELELDLSFVLDKTANTGRIAFPRLSTSADQVTRQWLGFSVDPSLIGQLQPPIDHGGPTPADFLNAWEPLASAPLMVIDLDVADGPSSLLVQPRQTQTSSQQRTEVVCGPGDVRWTFQADLNVAHGTRLQYEVVLPPSVTVDDVAVVQAGQSRLKSWARDAQGRLTLRLDQPLGQDHRLEIHASSNDRLPTPADTPLTVPDWTIDDVDRQSHDVDIYRHQQAQVRLVESTGYQMREDFVEGRFTANRGRWVASMTRDPLVEMPELKFRVLRNRPSTTGRMVTAVRRQTDGWWAEVDLHLTVEGGVLDALRLDIPSDWKGPFQVLEGFATTISDLAGKGRRYLLLRPEQAVQGDFQVRLQGPISSASRERIRVPDVTLLDAQNVESFVLLPTRVDQQRIIWERSGLQAQPLPESLRPLRGPADLPYAALRPRFQATIKDIQLESSLAFVYLADHSLELDADGNVLGVSIFDLQPGGRSECRLIVPPQCQVLHVTVADLPVSLLPGERHQFRIPLGSQPLPQRIRVLFSSRIDPDADKASIHPLQAPELQGIPVEQTAWTIRYPKRSPWQLVSPASETDQTSLDWLRVRSLDQVIATAEDVLKDGDPEEIVRWYVPWTRRWATMRSRLTTEAAGVEPDDDAVDRELAKFDENHRRVAERLDVQAHTLLAENEARHVFESHDTWRIVGEPYQVTHTLIATSDAQFPQIQRIEPPQPTRAPTLPVAAMLAGLTLLVMLLLPHPVLEEPMRRYPELLGVLLGAIWWWAFAASFAGFLMFSASLVWFLLRMVRRRRRRLAISSI